MKMGQMRSLLIVTLLIITGFSALLTFAPAEGGTWGPAYYHNGYIHFNVTYHDSSPAEGYRVDWSGNHGGGGPWTALDSNGEGVLNLTFNQIGEGTVRIRNLTFNIVHMENLYVNPDEHVYRNITLAPPPEPINIITGILRNSTSMGPMPGIEIRLDTYDDFQNDITHYNMTDQDGRYRFEVQNISHHMVYLYSPSTSGYESINDMLFMKEGIHHYEIDLYAYPFFKGDIESRIRFIDPTGEPILGYLFIDTMAVDNTYSWFDDEVGPDGDGWLNYTSSFGESYAYLNPYQCLLPNTTIHFNYYFPQNRTPLETEIPVDLSFLVPVEINVTNSTGPIQGANVNIYFKGEKEFGLYSADYYNWTDVNGTLTIHIPKEGRYSIYVSATGNDREAIEVENVGPDPQTIYVVMEERYSSKIPEKATINITCIDDETGLKAPYIGVSGGGSYDGAHYSFNGITDSSGLMSLVVDAITYNSINAYFNLATGWIEDVEVVPGEPNNFTLRMQRHEVQEWPVSKPYHFYVVDEEGDPVPGAVLHIKGQFQHNWFYGAYLTADQDGRIDILHVPNEELTIKAEYELLNKEWNPWAVQTQKLYPSESDVRLPDVTVYPRWEPEMITGVIKDSSTMEPLRFQNIQCHSIRPLETTRMMIKEDYIDGVEYFDINRYSNVDGFYRVYGLETAVLEVHREGYFVYKEEIQIEPTRADVVHDILLDPLPEVMAWLNGTLVDKDGAPISGELNITDIDHPGMGGNDIIIDETGEFSIALYPSSYQIRFFNESLEDTMDIVLTAEGIEDLELMLIPYSEISGRILDWEGEPVEGSNVTLLEQVGDELELVDWLFTGTDGNFSFMVEAGTYDVDIPASELYGHYIVHDIEVDGWDDWYSHLYLLNRTQADVSGTVTGTGGPYSEGVPGVTVALVYNTTIIASTLTESDGSFMLESVDHGTYIFVAEPPENLQPVNEIRSGYRTNQTNEFVVSGALVTIDPVLKYEINIPPENFTVDYNAPNGTGVYLDELITLGFSHVMNRSTVENAFSIAPEVANVTFTWDEWGMVVTIDHDEFMPNMTYFVTLGLGIISWEGYPMEGDDPFAWNFTTGNMTDPWTIISANVTLDEMELTVEVEAPTGQTIFISIYNAGYFRVVEASDGQYELVLTEENFEYETTYSYFFTDELNGMDKAPDFSGIFTTPSQPEPEWEITEAEVIILSGGDWKVRVEGNPGLDIYIVIDGVGSFKLQEEPPGDYAININYSEFEKGKSYDYHFSDTEDGEDKAPAWSGIGTDPRGDTTTDTETPWALIIFLLIIIILLIIGIIMVALVLANRKKEEEEDWGDEE